MKQYNFFTSSLFNGLDIIIEEPPQVIMISIPTKPQTYLDPYTDVIQILGRFRTKEHNQVGYYEEAIHLLSTNGTGYYKLKSEVMEWLAANQNVYDNILTLMYSNPNPMEKDLYKEAMRRLPFHKYLANEHHFNRSSPSSPGFPHEDYTSKYDLDYFKLDNLYEEERVNSYYANGKFLWEAYKDAGLVKVQNKLLHTFDVYLNYRYSEIEEQQKLNLKGGKRYSKENIRAITNQLIELAAIDGNVEYDEAVFNITRDYILVKRAFYKLGPDKIKELDYSISRIRQALIDHDVMAGKNANPVIDSVYNKFPVGVKLPVNKIKKDLQSIYDHYKLNTVAKASDILQWFEAKETRLITSKKKVEADEPPARRVEQRAFLLLKRKFNLHNNLERP